MKPATISEIKNALAGQSQKELTDICLRLAKFKKENKELLTFLLFEADDLQLFLKNAKEEVLHQFQLMNKSNLYLAKKSIRKALRITQNYIRFSGSKIAEVELLLYFCGCMQSSGLPFRNHPVTENIYLRQMEKIQKTLKSMHEDLQYDYGLELKNLQDTHP